MGNIFKTFFSKSNEFLQPIKTWLRDSYLSHLCFFYISKWMPLLNRIPPKPLNCSHDSVEIVWILSNNNPQLLTEYIFLYLYIYFYRLGVEQYRKEFSKQLHLIRNNDEFCDIDIHVGNETFRAHKVVLAAGSSYFHAMFCSGMMEDRADFVTLHEADPKVFAALLDFIYLGNYV